MSEQKSKSNTGKFVAIGVMVAIIIAAVVLLIVFSSKSEVKAVMQMSTNPSVQVILDGNDKVVAEIALNADGEKLLSKVSFMGLEAEVAATAFAEAATNFGKINTSGTTTAPSGEQVKVEITISADDVEEYKELAKKARDSVNEYFKENGIFAGAVSTVNNEVKAALEEMGVKARDMAEKSGAELMAFAKEKAEELNDYTITKRGEMLTYVEGVYNTVVSTLESAMQTAKTNYESASPLVQQAMKEAYDAAVKTYNNALKTFEEQIKPQIENILDECEAAWETVKTEAQSLYNTHSAAFEQRLNAFKQKAANEQQQIRDDIADFQASLVSA